MDNQNYAAQFYSGISNEIDILEKNTEEYPVSSVVRFMWLYHLKKNNDPSLNEVSKKTGIYLNNPLWMEYQLTKSVIEPDTVNQEISQNFISENESSENNSEEIISQSSEEIENNTPGDFNKEKPEETLPEPVNQEISQNFILENQSSENGSEELANEHSEEIELQNTTDINEQKPEEKSEPEAVNEEILQNPVSENVNTEIKNEEISNEPDGEIEHENTAIINEQKPEEETEPEAVNEEILQNPVSESENTEIKNEEKANEPVGEIEHENTYDRSEQKPKEETEPEAVNEEILQNPISENENIEIKNEEKANEPVGEIEHENTAVINEQKPEEEIATDVVNQEIPQIPILVQEEGNIYEGDEDLNKENPAEINQIISDNTFRLNENSDEETPIPFEPLHTVDYFASQGIKLSEEALANDHLGQQVKSFTAWLKTMKKLHPGQLPEQNEVIEKIIQSSAEVSNQNANVLTEAMAEVLIKQNKKQKA